MKKLNTKKAIKKIDSLLSLGEEISKSASELNRLKNTFSIVDNWNDPHNSISDSFITVIKPTIDDFTKLKIESFNYSVATGSTAVITTNASDYLFSNDQINEATLEILESIKNTILPQNKTQEIGKILHIIDSNLHKDYKASVRTYDQWKVGLKSNSDLGKDLRNVIEGFRGHLKIIAGFEKRKEISWDKIYQKIGIQSASNKNAFLKQRTIYEKLHKELTQITKNIITVDMQRMTWLFENTNDHIYSVLNFIDPEHLAMNNGKISDD